MPNANSQPINVLEKYAAKSSPNPIGISCFNSKVVRAKGGDGYNFATAERRNKIDNKTRKPRIKLDCVFRLSPILKKITR